MKEFVYVTTIHFQLSTGVNGSPHLKQMIHFFRIFFQHIIFLTRVAFSCEEDDVYFYFMFYSFSCFIYQRFYKSDAFGNTRRRKYIFVHDYIFTSSAY